MKQAVGDARPYKTLDKAQIQNLKTRLADLESLLSSYEVMIDKVYYNHLLGEYNSLNSIISAFDNEDTILAEKLLLKHKKLGREVVAIENYSKDMLGLISEYGFEIKESNKVLIVNGAGVSEILKNFDSILFYPYQTGECEFDIKDVRIDVFHASGAGGQNVNKVETAIRATHLPSGIVVVCQDERSQGRNRDKAIERLKAKVKEHYKKEADKQNKIERNCAAKNR